MSQTRNHLRHPEPKLTHQIREKEGESSWARFINQALPCPAAPTSS